ncbi:hypothetical protein [Streptosporangium sp. NPDC052375]|uniref:hypothetical protein n=1 Tax=Streptosporangium sp. NPDC052375 TaxID=3366195 RepID=UPI0037D798F7
MSCRAPAARVTHPDGSWARAGAHGDGLAVVHQSGPLRLWDLLEKVRHDWLLTGRIPLYRARARIEADGTIHLTRAGWRGRIG